MQPWLSLHGALSLFVLITSILRSCSNYIETELLYLPGHTIENRILSPLPYTYTQKSDLPSSFRWDAINGTSLITRSLNQHVPHWCGSCWAHGALSSLADRIKIDRNAAGDEINLSIQYVLNCGGSTAGSCLGGSPSGAYQFVFENGFVPYDTCQPYLACSSDSDFGFCNQVDTTCTPQNTCKTCSLKLEPSLHPFGQVCREIDYFPNATVAEYGVIRLNHSDIQRTVFEIQAEIFARGPVAATINGKALHEYHSGVYDDENASNITTHVVTLLGWETDDDGNQSWIARNSWGEYWGEMGLLRVRAGKNVLGIEHLIAWAVPGRYSVSNFACFEGGGNCGPSTNIVVNRQN